LAGDALQALAFELLVNNDLPAAVQVQLVRCLTQAAGVQGMVLGQAIDLHAVAQQLNLAQLEVMHQYKTGALIRASCAMGAMAVDATLQQLAALDEYAQAIGLAFQVQDDILDVTADTVTLGKQQGADVARNKPTYVSLLGLLPAQAKLQQLHDAALHALSSRAIVSQQLQSLAGYIVKRGH
jgi:farnesyl diphosphate synthase/geranylgeranyl diphosphate synthase type II